MKFFARLNARMEAFDRRHQMPNASAMLVLAPLLLLVWVLLAVWSL